MLGAKLSAPATSQSTPRRRETVVSPRRANDRLVRALHVIPLSRLDGVCNDSVKNGVGACIPNSLCDSWREFDPGFVQHTSYP